MNIARLLYPAYKPLFLLKHSFMHRFLNYLAGSADPVTAKSTPMSDESRLPDIWPIVYVTVSDTLGSHRYPVKNKCQLLVNAAMSMVALLRDSLKPQRG